jgi:protein-S-isoprenylcysteine O-methyltransferase Ste14
LSRSLLVAAACVPVAVLAMVSAWSLATNPAGGWVWPPDDVNASEAVAAGNYAELVRLLESGADPNRGSTVRPPLLAGQAVVATPIEAAVQSRNATMARLLLTRGAVVTPAMAAKLKCLNAEYPDRDVREILDELDPSEDPVCDGPGL